MANHSLPTISFHHVASSVYLHREENLSSTVVLWNAGEECVRYQARDQSSEHENAFRASNRDRQLFKLTTLDSWIIPVSAASPDHLQPVFRSIRESEWSDIFSDESSQTIEQESQTRQRSRTTLPLQRLSVESPSEELPLCSPAKHSSVQNQTEGRQIKRKTLSLALILSIWSVNKTVFSFRFSPSYSLLQRRVWSNCPRRYSDDRMWSQIGCILLGICLSIDRVVGFVFFCFSTRNAKNSSDWYGSVFQLLKRVCDQFG